MRIVVNSQVLKGLQTGIGRYVRNLYTALAQDPEFSRRCEILYFDGARMERRMPDPAEPRKWMQTAAAVWKLPDAAVTALRIVHWLGYEAALRRWRRRVGFDIYHETAFCPAAFRGAPTAFTLHDLSLTRWAHTHPRERVWFNRILFPRRIGYADHILTISHHVRREIEEALGWPRRRISVIYQAPAPVFHPRDPARVDAVRRRLGLPQDYLLFVGSLEPRKNLPTLLEALARSRCRAPLVLVGWDAWGDKGWLKRFTGAGRGPRVISTGYVDDDTVAALYSGARALVYPSLYEGFGLPILEAMACGCPVICSRTSAMPEAGGDAAWYVDPRDPDVMADAVDRVVFDDDLRRDLVRKGRAHAARFSWTKTARETLAVFESLAAAAGRVR